MKKPPECNLFTRHPIDAAVLHGLPEQAVTEPGAAKRRRNAANQQNFADRTAKKRRLEDLEAIGAAVEDWGDDEVASFNSMSKKISGSAGSADSVQTQEMAAQKNWQPGQLRAPDPPARVAGTPKKIKGALVPDDDTDDDLLVDDLPLPPFPKKIPPTAGAALVDASGPALVGASGAAVTGASGAADADASGAANADAMRCVICRHNGGALNKILALELQEKNVRSCRCF